MDFYISVYTLKNLDNIVTNYKRKILKDFHTINNFSIDYNKFENSILENNKSKPFIRSNKLDKNKCHSYIWKKGYGKVQCDNNHSINNFCKKHSLKQNYGIINFSY